MKDLLLSIISKELVNMQLKEKLIGFIVTKKKTGTYQALKDSGEFVDKVTVDLLEYLEPWFVDQLCNGTIREILAKELRIMLDLELHRRGYIPLALNKSL